MIRVGIVGIGGISRVHLNAYAAIEGAQLVCAADVRGKDAPNYKTATDMGAKVYESLDEMLEREEIDMLDVCTPTPLHGEMVRKGLGRGLHVLSEKPMCRTSEEAEALAELARSSRGKYMVAHVVRFMKPYAYLRSVVKSGELGRPVHIMMRRLSAVPRWSYEDWMVGTEHSGGAPLDLSIHDIDFIYSVFGEPRSVGATRRAFGSAQGFGANDYISSSLVYDGFSVEIIGAHYGADIPFTADYLAVFERGTVELRAGEVYKCGERVELDRSEDEGKETGINISSSDAYTAEIAYFISCIEQDKSPELVSPESSLGAIRLVERLCASAIEVG